MLSEEEKKAIEELKQLKKDFEIVDKIVKDRDKQETKTIETILNLIEKQNKIIDKMAEDIILLKECGWLTNITNKQDTIEFYTKLVEEEN